MYKYLTILILWLISLDSLAQIEDNNQHLIKKDSSYLFIDNTENCWYSVEIPTDTMFLIKGNIYFCNGKTLQANALQFDNGHSEGVRGSLKAEQSALTSHKKWELDYQKTVLRKRLRTGEELLYNENGKPFLIWWIKVPKKTIAPEKELELQTVGTQDRFSDSAAIELNVTYQLFLDFVVHGNKIVSICIPVFQNEQIDSEKQKLKAISNSLSVYGGFVDFNVLYQKSKSKENIILKDELDCIEITVPDFLNIFRSQRKNCFSASFPEKENIINTVNIFWQYKSDSVDFDDFIKNSQKHRIRENMNTISSDKKIRRVFYTVGYLSLECQDIYMEGDNIYCLVNYVATPTTYEYNKQRLDELVNRIVLK